MPTFRTTLHTENPGFFIRHEHRVMLIGSCFTEHIGAKLAAAKFRLSLNPNGIVYNPVSIARLLIRLSEPDTPEAADDLFFHQGLWHSWEHHSDFSRPDQAEAHAAIQQSFAAARQFLLDTDFLILTLGSAQVFELRENGIVVANNHKMPAALFSEKRLSPSEIVDALLPALERIRLRRPSLKVILTVSPVRHVRNGLVENQRSKAALLLACASLCERLPDTVYFPAYELQMDDLRDYRFYASDMIHPSAVAVDYIWSFFSQCYFQPDTQQLIGRIAKIQQAAAHRPFNPDTPEHLHFLQNQIEAIAAMQAKHPELDFSAETALFRQQMS